MNIGQQIIDGIIAAKLCNPQCAENPAHPCIIIWSSGAAEQIDAMVAAEDCRPYTAYVSARRRAEEAQQHVEELTRKNAELLADRERLDWLDSEASTDWWANEAAPGEPGTLRDTLDAKMNNPE